MTLNNFIIQDYGYLVGFYPTDSQGREWWQNKTKDIKHHGFSNANKKLDTAKNRLKKLMEMRKDPANRKKVPSRFQPAKKPAPMLKRGGSVKKKKKK